MEEKQYVSRYGIPFEVDGTYSGNDKHLIVYGTLAQMEILKMQNISCGGRFPANELIPITKQEADVLLNIALRSPITRK